MTEWRYYILDEQGRSARVVNGVVQYIGTPTWLPQTPDGWQDIAIMWERNMARYGPMRNFSLPLGFVMDGATILRDGLYKNNVDRKLYLLIQKRVLELDPVYFKDYYSYYYRGELDFTTAVDKQGESRFEVNIMEGGLWKLMKAKEDTVYSIPLDDDAINVKMDGLFLFSTYTMLSQQRLNTGYYYEGLNFINGDGGAPGLALLDVYSSLFTGTPIGPDNLNYFAQVGQNIQFTISGQWVVREAKLAGQVMFDLYVYNALTGNITGQQFLAPNNLNDGDTFSIAYQQNYIEGDRLFLVSNFAHDEATVTINNKARYKETVVKAFSAWQLFRKIVEKITGNADDAASSLLPTLTYVFTSGDGVRSLSDAVVKTSLKEFFEALNVYEMCGIGVENNKIILERRQHFFQYGNPIQCGSSKEMEISPATDLFFSRLKIGHKEQNIDDVNGKFDFNGQYNYGSPMLGVSNELTIVSPYKAGPYEIEITRINLEGKTTTDNDNDNDVFVIDVLPDGSDYMLNRTIPVFSGVPDPGSIFNVSLSPARLVRKHGAWIRGILEGYPSSVLPFNSANRNSDLVAGGITENADIVVSSLAAPMLSPWYFDYGTQVPAPIVDELEADQNRSIAGNWEGVPYEGYPIDIGIAPNTREEQKFKLLAVPGTDITKFIT